MTDRNIVGALAHASGYFLRRVLGGNRQPLSHVARRTEQICGRHVVRTIKPYCLEEHYARVRNTTHYTAREIIEEHLNRQSTELRPVYVHWVEDAWLIDGSVFVGGTQRIELRSALESRSMVRHYSLAPVPPCRDVDEGVLVGSCAGSTWFGHWLEDEVPLLMLGCAHGNPVAHVRREYLHEDGYRKALGLPAPARFNVAKIGRLAIVEEFAQNPNKTFRYELMRKRLSRRPKGHERVFLYRGTSGTPRNLVNERELAQRFAKEGFVTVDVGIASFDELLRQCLGATVVVGVEGSQLAHALFTMKDYGTMLILCPPRQVHTTVADIGIFCRLTSGMFVCEEYSGPGGSGFYAEPDEVLRFLDALIIHGERSQSALAAYVDEVVALGGKGDEVAILRGEAQGPASSAVSKCLQPTDRVVCQLDSNAY